VQPVYDRLDREPQTRAAIEEIQAMRSDGNSPPAVSLCSEADRRSRGAGKVTPIDGAYRVPPLPSRDDSQSGDEYRWVLDRGRFVFTVRGRVPERAWGTYNVTGDQFVFTIKRRAGPHPKDAAFSRPGEQFHFRWSLYRDELTLSPVPGKISPDNFMTQPWRRTGDAR
jgi:hypothetical protein